MRQNFFGEMISNPARQGTRFGSWKNPVEKGEFLATITDPYGKMRFKVTSPNEGYIINVNQSPIVNQGDAIFHISTVNTADTEAEEMED